MGHIKPNIVRVQNSQELAQEALSRFIASAQKAIDAQGVFRVAISGGHTPVTFYKRLSEKAAYSLIECDKVHVFWVDERCVPSGDEASNFGLADRTFLQIIPIPHENLHRIRGENADPAEAAREYEQMIKHFFGLKPGQLPQFDWVMLGLGTDGHIGSLFPNTGALADTKKMVCAVCPVEGGLNRITLTVPVIRQASQIVILVSGLAKAEIVHQVFQSATDEVKYPVHSLWPVMHKITWIIDRQAALLIP